MEERESLQADIDKLASTIGCINDLNGEGGYASDDDDIYIAYEEPITPASPSIDDWESRGPNRILEDDDAASVSTFCDATPLGSPMEAHRSVSRSSRSVRSRPMSPALSQAPSEESDTTSATSESTTSRSLHLRGPLGDKVAGGRPRREDVSSLSSFPVFASGPIPPNADPDTLRATNQSYQKMLQACLGRIELALTDNREKQAMLAGEIEQALKSKASSKTLTASAKRVSIANYSYPYFKDSYGGFPPPNADTLVKKRTRALTLDTIKYPTTMRKWAKQEDNDLKEAIVADLKQQLVTPLVQRLALIRDKTNRQSLEESELADLEEKKLEAQNELKRFEELEELDLIVAEFSEEPTIDWMKIASVDMNGCHTAGQCQRRWATYLHPKFNKALFSNEEDGLLKILAKNNSLSDWDEVSRSMGLKRSGWQCFERFQRKHNDEIYMAGTKWTAEEDEYLKEIVEHFRIGPNIMWHQVAYFVDGRTAAQCAQRWQNSLDDKRIGTWTQEEDEALLKAAETFRVNEINSESAPGYGVWARVAQMIPGRRPWQCRERYTRHVDPRIDRQSGWSWEEDVLLVKAVKRAGTYAWIAIAKKYFPNRTDVMCMRRYRTLLKWKKQQQWVDHLDPEIKRYADTYSQVMLDRRKNRSVKRELLSRPSNVDGQEIPRPQYAHLFGRRSHASIEKTIINRTKIWKMIRDKIQPKTHQEEEHILQICSLFRESTPIREILRFISEKLALNPSKSKIKEQRRKDFVTKKCLDLEEQMAVMLSRTNNFRPHSVIKGGRPRHLRFPASMFSSYETQEEVEKKVHPLVLAALGVDVMTALWRTNKLKIDWLKQERILKIRATKYRRRSCNLAPIEESYGAASLPIVENQSNGDRQPKNGENVSVANGIERHSMENGSVPEYNPAEDQMNGHDMSGDYAESPADDSETSGKVNLVQTRFTRRSSALEAKRMLSGNEISKLSRVQTLIDRSAYLRQRRRRDWDAIAPEEQKQYNLTQEKALLSVDMDFLEGCLSSLNPEAFGGRASSGWQAAERPARLFPLSLIHILPPNRVTLSAFKTLLTRRDELRERAAMLWAPKLPECQKPDGHLKYGVVNQLRRDNFLKVMRTLKRTGKELKTGAVEDTFSGYGIDPSKEANRKRKRDAGEDSSSESDEGDADLDKEAYVERKIARYEARRSKRIKRTEEAKMSADQAKQNKKIERGLLTSVKFDGGSVEKVVGESEMNGNESEASDTVGNMGHQTIGIRTKGVGYHQQVSVEEVVEVAKALQRNEAIENVVALNKSAKNLSVKEMLALKRGKMDAPKEARKRVPSRPVPGRDSPQILDANAKRRKRYILEWEKIQQQRKKSSAKMQAMEKTIRNQNYKPEHFLRTSYAGLLNAKQKPEYLLLRQRFRAIFLWPEILASCSPPAVRIELQQKKPSITATANVDPDVVIVDVSEQKDNVITRRAGGTMLRGRSNTNLTVASQGRKYVTNERVGRLTTETVDVPFAVSSLHEEIIEDEDDNALVIDENRLSL